MDNKIFLVGSCQFKKKILKPFDEVICDFFDLLSKEIYK
jgi:hypothetical protein